jgi:hypothetical protein
VLLGGRGGSREFAGYSGRWRETTGDNRVIAESRWPLILDLWEEFITQKLDYQPLVNGGDEISMTIGMGLICAQERYILLCSDTRFVRVDENGTIVSTCDGIQKIRELSNGCYACTSDNLSECDELIKCLKSKFPSECDYISLKKALKEIHQSLKEESQDALLRDSFGFDLQYYRKTLEGQPQLVMMVQELFKKNQRPFAKLCIGTFHQGKPVLFKYFGNKGTSVPCCTASMSIIGSREKDAQHSFASAHQNPFCSLPKSFTNIYQAKKSVEGGDIGPGTDIALLSAKGGRLLDRDKIEKWNSGTEDEFHAYFGTDDLRTQ